MLNGFPTFIEVVQGNKNFALNFTLQDALGSPVNLSGATLAFNLQSVEDPTIQSSGPMMIANPLLGTCQYVVQATDFAVAGTYDAQIAVSYSVGGELITWDGIQIVATPSVPIPN